VRLVSAGRGMVVWWWWWVGCVGGYWAHGWRVCEWVGKGGARGGRATTTTYLLPLHATPPPSLHRPPTHPPTTIPTVPTTPPQQTLCDYLTRASDPPPTTSRPISPTHPHLPPPRRCAKGRWGQTGRVREKPNSGQLRGSSGRPVKTCVTTCVKTVVTLRDNV